MLTSVVVRESITQHRDDPLDLLHALGGYYECPVRSGNRVGPLVGYAGRYGPDNEQWVGDVYANVAKAEKWPVVIDRWACDVARIMPDGIDFNVAVGLPEGGRAFAFSLAREFDCQYLYPEKRVTKPATGNSREESELVFKRHEIESGMRVALVEDVANNFSTTGAAIDLVKKLGGEVICVVCILNRSTDVDDVFAHDGSNYPVFARVRKPIPQYRQNDAAVTADIAAGNVVWKAKDEWPKLMAAMAKNV